MFLLYIVISIIVIFIVYKLIILLWKNNAKNKTKDKYKELGYEILESDNKAYDFIALKDEKKSLIKVLYNYGNHEINVNSKDYFQRNKGVVSSRKKGNKIENVYDLINYKTKDKKVYIVYPDSVRMMKVINECEMIFIDNNTDCYGTNFITFKNIQ